ncbi:hypothetical protein [Microbacterium arborescens]|uniref:hypothetical protein n=1 Tax=Microbacterium arborescens TaxID=33883 RepID=UPI00277E017B|nr:hypothetical protein [Microbacterium arborescens]MDQ1217782.1 hypothetical protein [Microbacterium arborescens]
MKSRQKSRRLRLIAGSIAASAAIVLTAAVPASAAEYSINAQLNCAGSLFEGDTFRPHSAGGASIQLTRHDWWKNNWALRTGLRVPSGAQTTGSLEFSPASREVHRYRTTSGNTTIPSGSYAVNARVNTNANGGCVLWPPSFEAKLNL